MQHTNLFRGGYAIRDQSAPHFLTFTICGWIDLLTRKAYKDIIIDSLKYCQTNKQLGIHAYVIMSNHVHLILSAKGEIPLSDIIRDFKKFTHRQFIAIVNSEQESRRLWMLHQFAYYGSRHSKPQDYQIWTNDNHPEGIYTYDFAYSKVHYTHLNPVRAGVVSDETHYLYSSAGDYAGGKGLIDIELLY